ncbi:hypothetical protein D0C36_21445 [Mucilaginibacter conchicola]|uniref:Uncharacterized protein n=1 Tax=Mucilaginibacter conchicola TaxID=2303333 RepID=A0A372NN59_9SPHI|nr:hypothetical protein [Mucilaginibacter conchicola]RFZ90359.1 hypothetical protein D0C36_21445 [Mucilaginibacter conchicola]
MTKAQYQQAIQTERLPLTPWEKFDHFGIVTYCLIPAAMLLCLDLYGWISNDPQIFDIRQVQILSISIIVSGLFFWLQRSRLPFHIIPAALYKQDLKQIALQVLKELNWRGRFNGNVCVVRIDRGFFSGSWGEQVTIIIDEDRILINSICDLNKRSSITSWGNNAKNIKHFTAKFEEYALRQIKAQSPAIKIEN